MDSIVFQSNHVIITKYKLKVLCGKHNYLEYSLREIKDVYIKEKLETKTKTQMYVKGSFFIILGVIIALLWYSNTLSLICGGILILVGIGMTPATNRRKVILTLSNGKTIAIPVDSAQVDEVHKVLKELLTSPPFASSLANSSTNPHSKTVASQTSAIVTTEPKRYAVNVYISEYAEENTNGTFDRLRMLSSAHLEQLTQMLSETLEHANLDIQAAGTSRKISRINVDNRDITSYGEKEANRILQLVINSLSDPLLINSLRDENFAHFVNQDIQESIDLTISIAEVETSGNIAYKLQPLCLFDETGIRRVDANNDDIVQEKEDIEKIEYINPEGVTGKLNINTANAESIKNLGSLLTSTEINKIINERERHGDYYVIQDLESRTRISPMLINQIKNKICFLPSTPVNSSEQGRILDF